MKLPLYISLLLVIHPIVGQITYAPVFLNQCTQEVEGEMYWYLTDSARVYRDEEMPPKKIQLPKVGQYQLHYALDHVWDANLPGNSLL
ncbi:MAG: hypothetical protein AAF399_27570 [Bacteroidota bacterium]